jgi:hypothetical protein
VCEWLNFLPPLRLVFCVCVLRGVKAAASPVLEQMIMDACQGWDADCTVRILGAAPDAVVAFLRFLYSHSR